MARKRNAVEVLQTKFVREERLILDGFEILRGDTIKVKGQYGGKFKFDYLTTNSETGSQWVDCFELQRGATGAFRSFKIEDIKRVPKRRKRAKRVV